MQSLTLLFIPHAHNLVRPAENRVQRQLDDVLFHETDHKPRPDIQYGGSVSVEE